MDRPQTFDREKLHINLARLKSHGESFEVVVDPDLAIKYRTGEITDIREVLKSENVFHDAKKGDLASKIIMENVFETTDTLKVIEKILKEGEIQLTSEYREKLRDEKKKQLLDLIHKYAVDPKTGSPHPITRLENAMKEAKVLIDEHKSAEDQVQDVVSKLRPILPISFEVKKIEIHLKPEHAAKLYGTIQRFGTLMKDEWLNDGSWMGVVEIPGGLEPDLYDKLNDVTHGDVEAKVIK